MPLHTAAMPDWEKIPADKHNFWQRRAAASKGVFAPANFVSLIGAIAVIIGLFLLLEPTYFWWGILLIMLGRAADIADGYVADKTGTKSPFGEAMDATIDKILLGLALIFFVLGNILPVVVTAILLAHTVYNTLIGFVGYFRKLPVHPSRFGKYATFSEWLCIGLFLALSQISLNTTAYTLTTGAAWLSLLIFGLFALPSSYSYGRDYLQKSRS
jgi:phosphatidylglycerophosphate synthase